MSCRLDRIQNWPELAREGNWSVAALAKRTGLSVRMLERYFSENMRKSPKSWLAEQRQKRAMGLLHDGCSVKEAASQLGYTYPQNFSREFKAYWGFSPSAQNKQNKPPDGNQRILV